MLTLQIYDMKFLTVIIANKKICSKRLSRVY